MIYLFKVSQKFAFYFNRRSRHHAHKRKYFFSYWNYIGVKYLQHFHLIEITDVSIKQLLNLWKYKKDTSKNSSHFFNSFKIKIKWKHWAEYKRPSSCSNSSSSKLIKMVKRISCFNVANFSRIVLVFQRGMFFKSFSDTCILCQLMV